jgi:phenylalanyl-tRNA synthetase beta subunit
MAGRSVAWRLVFRAPDRTLKDDEVEAAVAKVVKGLKERLDVQLRQT